MVRAVFFDVDDTLVDYTTTARRALDEAMGAGASYKLWQQISFVLFDDVLSCLGALRADSLRLGVITNNDGVHQRRKLAAVGLGDAFDVVVISGEFGVGKPDPAIFSHACAELGVDAGAALHVGDRLDADALGALGAGLRGIWLDRLGVAGDERRMPVVATLAAVPALVA